MSNMPEKLPPNVEEGIFLFVKNLNSFTKPLGKGIFDVIEKECIVVYYPIMDADETNDGFFLPSIPLKNGEYRNIIFINTFQTEEKQVFIAAHEYGHYLKVADVVNNKCGTQIDNEIIVNRFAAELLMPRDLFRRFFVEKFKDIGKDKKSVGLIRLFDCIVATMEHFSVPYNAVVIRLVETGLIRREDGIKLVDGDEQLTLDDIENIVNQRIVDGEYNVLRTSSHKKNISGLKELLDKAEEQGNISQAKIDRLRENFGIVTVGADVLEEEIKITEEE